MFDAEERRHGCFDGIYFMPKSGMRSFNYVTLCFVNIITLAFSFQFSEDITFASKNIVNEHHVFILNVNATAFILSFTGLLSFRRGSDISIGHPHRLRKSGGYRR